MKKNLIMLIAVLGLSLTLSGCFKSPSQKAAEKMVEKTIEAQTGGKVDIDTKGGSMNLKTDDGNMQISTGGEVSLPDNFPKELIIAGDAKVIVSSYVDKTISVAYVTNVDQVELFGDYKTELTNQGWTKDFEMDAGTAKMVNFKKSDQRASFTISDNDNNEHNEITIVSILLSSE